MKIHHKVIIFSSSCGLLGIFSGCAAESSAPPRPTSASAMCMENTIDSLKRARIRFNNSQSEGDKCFAARDFMDVADRSLAQTTGAVVVTPQGSAAVIGSTYTKRQYEKDCPNDSGPNAQESYNDHVFALSAASIDSCPTDFKIAYQEYVNGWRQFKNLAERMPAAPLSYFHRVADARSPRNQFEQQILTAQQIVVTAQPRLWKFFQRDTGWCHDPRYTHEVIYWRGCPPL